MKLCNPGYYVEGGPEPLAVRVPTALGMTGLSRSKFYELVQDGEIETVKVGRGTLVIVSSLRAFLERRSQKRLGISPN